MLSNQEDQAERRRVLANDARVREQDQAGTFLSHTHSDAGGRFAQVGAQTVVGADPIPQYPPASSPWQGPDLVGQEPPLGYSVNDLTPHELEPSMAFVEAQEGGPADAPSTPLDVERTGPSPSSGDPAGVHFPSLQAHHEM
jgi:hypothetical protein